MSNSHMTPAWVVENFLPDYKKKYQEEVGQYYDKDFGFAPGNESLPDRFERKHFPEALSELLKAQRTNCTEAYDAYPFDGIICARIQDAPIPEPKNQRS